MIAGYVHVDEIHDYIDASTKKTRPSIRHIHILFVPEQDEKLNGKAVCCKKNMIAVNNEIDKMCKDDYGAAFLTGEKQSQTRT